MSLKVIIKHLPGKHTQASHDPGKGNGKYTKLSGRTITRILEASSLRVSRDVKEQRRFGGETRTYGTGGYVTEDFGDIVKVNYTTISRKGISSEDRLTRLQEAEKVINSEGSFKAGIKITNYPIAGDVPELIVESK